jgi:hypothetical protein
MAIKSFTFSFKLDAKDLLEFVTERNVAVNIEAFGTAPKQPQPLALPAPNQGQPKKLPLPTRRGSRPGIQAVIIGFLVRRKEGASTAALRALIQQTGYAPSSINNQLYQLRHTGLVKSPKKGIYRATAKAIKASMVAEHDY